jgi:hypothetical protein
MFWILVLSISLGHLASSLRIERGEIIQTHFSFTGRRVPLSELKEVKLVRSIFPVILRFEQDNEMHVSGMANDNFLSFLQEIASEVRIIDSLKPNT